jgi:Domain of unknown function (DUF4296)
MRNYLFVLMAASCMLMIACKQKANGSAQVLPEKKMEDILWDLNRADMLVDMRFIRDSTLVKKEESIRLYEQIFAVYKTNQEQVKKSLAYYQSQPVILKRMLDSLNTRQEKSMQNLYSKPAADTATGGKPPLQSDIVAKPDSMEAVNKRIGDSIRNLYKQKTRPEQLPGRKKMIPLD